VVPEKIVKEYFSLKIYYEKIQLFYDKEKEYFAFFCAFYFFSYETVHQSLEIDTVMQQNIEDLKPR
jgi:hypothetical protein